MTKPNEGCSSGSQRLEIFAQAIVEGMSQSEAYRLAFPDAGKGSKRGGSIIHEKASRFAAGVKVRSRVRELAAMHRERHIATVDSLLRTLTQLVNLNPAVLFDKQGRLLPIHKIPADVCKLLSFEHSGAGIRFKVDKLRALELLGRFHKMWTDGAAAFLPPAGVSPPNQAAKYNFFDNPPEQAARAYRELVRQVEVARDELLARRKRERR